MIMLNNFTVYNRLMRIYFSGIGGVGIGPLAEIAADAGYDIVGSDLSKSLVTEELERRGISLSYDQSGDFLQTEHEKTPIDWYIHTAALPNDHPELQMAQQLGIRTGKRDELLAHIIADKQLKLIAISGTHGKTTTTGMMVWAMQQLGMPVSYSIGTTLSWGPSGHFDPSSQYFVYECDEFDRNFLHFYPHLSIITALDYDHPDTYPTQEEYAQGFIDFISQSDRSLLWEKDLRYLRQPDIAATYQAYDELMDLSHITLAGDHTRHNAFLVEQALQLLPDIDSSAVDAINRFPGTNRRFERLAPNIYSDYGHHPVEIAATLQMARELSDTIVLVYQPHQNVRQHEIQQLYSDEIFKSANMVYWLPTYLSRENPELRILSPEELTSNLAGTAVEVADMDDHLWSSIQNRINDGALILCMGAGSIDDWIRQRLASDSL